MRRNYLVVILPQKGDTDVKYALDLDPRPDAFGRTEDEIVELARDWVLGKIERHIDERCLYTEWYKDKRSIQKSWGVIPISCLHYRVEGWLEGNKFSYLTEVNRISEFIVLDRRGSKLTTAELDFVTADGKAVYRLSPVTNATMEKLERPKKKKRKAKV